MPVYEYKCKICDEQFEIEQSFTDETLTSLEGCAVDDDGNHQLKKVFRAVGISFKGDGFYRNDARSGSSSGGTNKTESPTKSESTPSTSDSSDSSNSSTGSTESASKSSSSSDKTSSTKSDKPSTSKT